MTNQTLKGFRDFFSKDLFLRYKVIDIIKQTFNLFGFSPLETPSIEYAETLLGKYGEDADKLVYTFPDRGDRQVGLRYDLTVPLSRVMAQYNQAFPLPFKRYQIQPVWRAENTQRGRYREFLQCDIDTIGINSYLADAEIIAAIFTVFKNLNFQNFVIKINSREILFSILEKSGLTDKIQQLSVIRTVDKLDKIGVEGVKAELKSKNVPEQAIVDIFSNIKNAKPGEKLSELINSAKALGVPENILVFDPTLSRGLDYYTGPIFEVVSMDAKIGSLAGGGRYDNLIKTLGGPNLPATGIALGFERIIDLIKELKLLPEEKDSKTQILVVPISENELPYCLKLSQELRSKNIATEIYLEVGSKVDKQIKYADKKSVPFVALVGQNEVKNNIVTLKTLVNGKQGEVNLRDLGKMLQENLINQ